MGGHYHTIIAYQCSQKYIRDNYVLLTYSVVILALNPRKSGQIANKWFIFYYGRYKPQLELPSKPLFKLVKLTNVHQEYITWWKNRVMVYLCYKQTNFRNMFNNYQRTIPGWLTLFYMYPFSQNDTSYYAKNHISSVITMQIVNVIYGFVCFEGLGIWISQKKRNIWNDFLQL